MISSTQTNHPLATIKSAEQPISLLEKAFGKLRAEGLRITQPRIAILTVLLNREQPTSIEQIHADLADGSCDLVTVYRCLAAFEEIGIVRRSFYHNGTSLYEINLSNEHRYHVVSKTSCDVEPLDPESTAELRETIQRIEARLVARGHTGVSHVVEFFSTTAAPSRSALTKDAPTRSQANLTIN